MDNSKQLPTVLSLCTGYGGIERGLELAGFEHRVIAHVEIEAFAAANLVAKMEQGRMVPAPIWSDLKTLPVECFRDGVSLITGGYPCQPFSAAGKRAGKDDPRHLWPWIRDHIQAIRPVRCFFENVEGHISLGLREVIEDLEGLGYATTWGVFSAAEVGAPHQRKRVYILADSDSARQQSDQREGQARHDAGGRGQELADSDSFRYDRRKLPDEIRERALEIETQPKPKFSRPQSELEGHRGSIAKIIPDSLRERGCGGHSEWQDAAHAGELSTGSRGNSRGVEIWDFEPQLGRVAHGIADRVDRLRLLGNGVVPQTAAKAWTTLSEQIQGR